MQQITSRPRIGATRSYYTGLTNSALSLGTEGMNKATLKVDSELLKIIKLICVKKSLKIQDFAEEALRNHLQKVEK